MVMDCPGYSKEFDPTRMFRRILVPIDFSKESRRALITACETRRHFDSEIHLLVETNYEDHSALRGLGVPYSYSDAKGDAEEQLTAFARSICSGTPCLYHKVIFGKDIVKDIVKTVAEKNCTMVILGVHPGHSLFRTEAEKIIQRLDVPVLVLQGATMNEDVVDRASRQGVVRCGQGADG